MLKERVYQSIKNRIIVQELKPGDRLNEKELMDEYEIGKTPLREIFFRLQHDGLIRRFPRSGTIVAPIDFKELRDAAEIRLALEGLVARLAARRMTRPVLDEMARLIGIMEANSGNGVNDDFISAETSLHSLLYDTADNMRLKAFITEQHSLFARMWFSTERTHPDLMGQIADWKGLYQAFLEGDEDKAEAVNRAHFDTYYNHLKSLF